MPGHYGQFPYIPKSEVGPFVFDETHKLYPS